MESFPVFEQDNPNFSIQFWNERVKLNSSVWLNIFAFCISHNPLGNFLG